MQRCDVAVIGGGPAGAAAAILAARRGLSVAVFERGTPGRDKVCGEYVSAEALPLLQGLVPGLAAAAPAIDSAVWISARGRRAAFHLPHPARGISRLKLDAALWEAAGAAGAVLHSRTAVTAYRAAAPGAELDTGAGTYHARHIVLAAGRWWRLPGLAAAAPAPSAWVGVKARLAGLAPSSAVEMFVFRGGYCGLAPVENGWTNACCLIHREAAGALSDSGDFSAWITAAAAHPALAERLRPGRQATATVVTAPVMMGAHAAVRAGALLTGDAAGFVDPFTGDGLARALLSAQLAVRHLDRPEAYAAALRRAGGRSFRVGAALRWLMQAPPWLQEGALRGLARPRWAGPLVAATRWRTL
ncbi:MAG TPA: FAD-dependent oxidoreductase [Terriglobales bacterium]|jgi:flavin-dependent dehydrogenase